MPKKHEPTIADDEKEIFRHSMRGVKPLSSPNKIIKKTVVARKKISPKETDTDFPLNLSESDYAEKLGPETLIEFHRPGLQHKMLRNLRQGKNRVEAMLDMHGMKISEARDAVSEFLIEAKKSNLRHLLIIHGKGHGSSEPVLKNQVNQWLRQVDFVIAFCSANPREGSSGAVYVLLAQS